MRFNLQRIYTLLLTNLMSLTSTDRYVCSLYHHKNAHLLHVRRVHEKAGKGTLVPLKLPTNHRCPLLRV